MFTKNIWYDWNGANAWIFSHINALHGAWYDWVMLLLSRIADHHNFPYYMLALAAYVFVAFIIRKISRSGGSQYFATVWFATFLVLVAGFAADALMVKGLKHEFNYPRPYAVITQPPVRVIDPANNVDESNISFPSGHESFATLMVVGLWPVLSPAFAWAGAVLLVGVAWSRVALGMHFPADVVGGFLLTFILVLIVRRLVYGFMRVFLGLKC